MQMESRLMMVSVESIRTGIGIPMYCIACMDVCKLRKMRGRTEDVYKDT